LEGHAFITQLPVEERVWGEQQQSLLLNLDNNYNCAVMIEVNKWVGNLDIIHKEGVRLPS
jgi:predicted RecB family nuclease